MVFSSVILGIETSCDETSAAVLADGHTLLSHITSSQIDVHHPYGGVVPEIASREHCLHIDAVVEKAMEEAHLEFRDLSAVAVTYGPGLVGSLLVGVAYAKALAFAAGLPLIGVNHLEAHVLVNLLEHPHMEFPLLALLASGGHTNILYFEDYLTYRVVGRTRDDAAGEAFDKVARTLNLGYPGGPPIERAAARGNEMAFELPRSLLEPGSLDFSFSGLKSAVLNLLNTARMKGHILNTEDVAASFQRAVIDVLLAKIRLALDHFPDTRALALAGGVAANSALRQALAVETQGQSRNQGQRESRNQSQWQSQRQSQHPYQYLPLYVPSVSLCTDNGAMVATAGYYYYLADRVSPWTLNAVPGLGF
ncbi:MAG: tRNA (adenosine(37)-N6)-threonylcarbamoyltransferase complex transferase subunit TsaD [Peptococcaceae bacterium]|nr:tRNA (adenosine(37)-N6)-threonylcarbamoyltransferase complex transferase subunit TsaD [Peptococcaceae bacterium]